jgi:hypothetical protein
MGLMRRLLVAALTCAATDRAFAESGDAVPSEEPVSFWLGLTDDEPYDPPIVTARGGVIVWPFLRTAIRIAREGGSSGSEIVDSESSVGLPGEGVSPWVEASVGTSIRIGANFLDLLRVGSFTVAREPIEAAGKLLAKPGDAVSARVHYTQADAFLQWDVLSTVRYRIGLMGGARLLRFTSRLRGFQLDRALLQSVSTSDLLVAPFFGGQIELEPVPLFTVFANIRYIDWAWKRAGLEESRTFESRIGFSITVLEELVGVALDFRFLSTFVDPEQIENEGRTRARYQLDAAGIAVTITFRL